jgi:hypothetical protein
MQTSPLIPGSKELISQSFQIPPSSSVFSRGSLAPTDTITFHSEAQPSEQEPSQETSSSLTDCFSSVLAFVQNIPSSLWNFFTGIVSYCLSFCSSQDHLDREAVRTFLGTQFQGNKEEKADAIFNAFNALPQNVKGMFCALLISDSRDLRDSSFAPTSPEFTAVLVPVLKNVIQGAPIVLKLFLHAWLIVRELRASTLNANVPASLTNEQILTAAQTFVDALPSYTGSEEEKVATLLQNLNALPEAIKEWIFTMHMFLIIQERAEKSYEETNDFNTDLNPVIQLARNPIDFCTNDSIQEHIQTTEKQVYSMDDTTKLVAAWILEQKRGALPI